MVKEMSVTDNGIPFIVEFISRTKNESSVIEKIPNQLSSCCETHHHRQKWKEVMDAKVDKLPEPEAIYDQTRSLDGILHFPEYDLCVAPSLTCPDIHSLARQSLEESGVLHGVIQPIDAAILETQEYSKRSSSFKQDCHPAFEFKDILGDEHSFTVRLIRLERSPYYDSSYDITGEDSAGTEPIIRSTLMLTKDDLDEAQKLGIDATIIFGDAVDQYFDYFLLNARVHSQKWMIPTINEAAFLTYAMSKIAKGGWECRRTGGSNGMPDYDDDFYEALHVPDIYHAMAKV